MRTVKLYIFHCIMLVVLTVFAFRTGGLDYVAYYLEFLEPEKYAVSNEVGYRFLIISLHGVFGFWFVLLLANLLFYFSHRKFIRHFIFFDKAFVFFVYFIYLSLFLILGSPRRLIAYSFVFVVLYTVFNTNRISFKTYIYPFLASFFHVSAIIIVPVVIFFRYNFKSYFKARSLLYLIFLFSFIALFLYQFGIVDYILLKIKYYQVYALKEQEYLNDVPSVYSGLLKRMVVILLFYFSIRKWVKGKAIIKLCAMEVSLYFFLGLISPVLSVVATYLSSVYIFPFICPEYNNSSFFKRCSLVFGAVVYYLPTIVGLIKLFGDVYVG
ncbi:EpsG family protein [Aeromonas veronii]|uniref:EpsG family protein n=1 Tax=Aeromonas veronii TaxID=654 RepID=UPI0011CAA9B5|nr:EpsG family protein [Aeromonas veronii]